MEYFKILIFVLPIVLTEATSFLDYRDYYEDALDYDDFSQEIEVKKPKQLDVRLGSRVTLECNTDEIAGYWDHNGHKYFPGNNLYGKPFIGWNHSNLIIEINSEFDGGKWNCYRHGLLFKESYVITISNNQDHEIDVPMEHSGHLFTLEEERSPPTISEHSGHLFTLEEERSPPIISEHSGHLFTLEEERSPPTISTPNTVSQYYSITDRPSETPMPNSNIDLPKIPKQQNQNENENLAFLILRELKNTLNNPFLKEKTKIKGKSSASSNNYSYVILFMVLLFKRLIYFICYD